MSWVKKANDYIGGDCFANVIKWLMKHVDEGWEIVHGKVVHPLNQKKIEHAWLEKGDMVMDPTTDLSISVPEYYEAYSIENGDLQRYNQREAMRNLYEHKHYGPWT